MGGCVRYSVGFLLVYHPWDSLALIRVQTEAQLVAQSPAQEFLQMNNDVATFSVCSYRFI